MNCGDGLGCTNLPEDPKLKGDALTKFLKDLFSPFTQYLFLHLSVQCAGQEQRFS